MSTVKRKVPSQFPRFSSRYSHRRRFFSGQQYGRGTLQDSFRKVLRLEAQAPEVSDEQAIMQAMRADQLRSHLVRERPQTLKELYEEFQKFSRSEVSHFHMLDQQRKTTNENEASRPFKYSKGKEGATSFDTARKQVHSIDSEGSRPPRQETESIMYDSRQDHQQNRGGYSNQGRGRGRKQEKSLYSMIHERDTDHRTKDCPIFLESKKKDDTKAKPAFGIKHT
jgi:hypothetical protein